MEPGRKLQRRPLAPIIRSSKQKGETPLVFATRHPEKPGVLDLRSLAEGETSNVKNWGGDYQGRPELIAELAPHVYALHIGSPEGTTINVVRALKSYWRLLDSLDSIAPVRTVSDLTHIHEAEQFRKRVPVAHTNTFLRIVNARRLELGLARLIWTKPDRPETATRLPERTEVKAIYEELKHLSWDAIRRVEEDDHVARGRDWAEDLTSRRPNLAWTPTELRATYKGFIAKLAHPCPTREMILRATGGRDITSLSTLAEIDALYFRLEDVQALFHLFLLFTGWNPQTALDIDLSEDPVEPHPTAAGFHLVRSVKTRGNSEQVALGQTKRELAPGNIILMLKKRTEPLRRYLESELEKARGGDDLQLVFRLQRAVKSPWLYPLRDGVVKALDSESCRKWDNSASFMKYVIRRVNARRSPKGEPPIFEGITATDLRDAFISYAYERSGYNWLIAKLAAGHLNINSTRVYLHKTHWASFGHSQVRKLLRAMWSDIAHRKIVEPAFLFAMVQRGEISEEQRRRWIQHKDRTRVGVGCKSFRAPPKHLAPEHKEGTGCRVFRCTLCPHAIVFDDSVDLLARRHAELESIRASIPLVSWEQSTFPDELESLDTTLELFAPDVVRVRLLHWREEINAGRHVVAIYEGAYE